MRNIKAVLQIIMYVFFVLGIATASAANILNDTVEIQYLYPDSSTQYGISITGVVTEGGLALNLFDNQNVIVFPSFVQIIGIKNPSSNFVVASFNGVSIQDLTNPSAFAGFSINPASNVAGFDISDVSLVNEILYINMQGLTTPYGSLAQVDFTAQAAVPEPTTMFLLSFGLIGLVGVRRFRK